MTPDSEAGAHPLVVKRRCDGSSAVVTKSGNAPPALAGISGEKVARDDETNSPSVPSVPSRRSTLPKSSPVSLVTFKKKLSIARSPGINVNVLTADPVVAAE